MCFWRRASRSPDIDHVERDIQFQIFVLVLSKSRPDARVRSSDINVMSDIRTSF